MHGLRELYYKTTMTRRSKTGKFRPRGIVSKIKFDILPPQGDAEVSLSGFGALAVAAALVAVVLSSFSKQLATILAVVVVSSMVIKLYG